MKKLACLAVLALCAAVVPSLAADKMKADPMVGGSTMYPSKDIVDNAVDSADHTTLVAAVKAAGLVETLKGKGPFTVFAPTNAAFAKLPAGTVESLLKPESKDDADQGPHLSRRRRQVGLKDLAKKIKDGNGTAKLTTVSGGTLTITIKGGKSSCQDEKGGTATVTIADVYQTNGVIHVVDTVFMPN